MPLKRWGWINIEIQKIGLTSNRAARYRSESSNSICAQMNMGWDASWVVDLSMGVVSY